MFHELSYGKEKYLDKVQWDVSSINLYEEDNDSENIYLIIWFKQDYSPQKWGMTEYGYYSDYYKKNELKAYDLVYINDNIYKGMKGEIALYYNYIEIHPYIKIIPGDKISFNKNWFYKTSSYNFKNYMIKIKIITEPIVIDDTMFKKS
jgi:hypothetical protein